MKGREVIKVNRTFTLDELLAFMDANWNAAENGGYMKGRPTPASIEEYIMLPATQNCLVIVYPRKEKVILSVCQSAEGAKMLLVTGIPVQNAIAKIMQASASVALATELRGPANDVMQIYADRMRQILGQNGLL